jgi:nucleotide-binding universal stress UspA family protein
MKWLVGLDLRASSRGALHFAAWVASRARDQSVTPIHVLEEEHLHYVLRYRHLDEVMREARAAAEDAIVSEGAASRVGDVRIVQGLQADETLAEACVAEGAAALVVGRLAKTKGRPIVRLGRVARRLIRKLPVPLVVVPPDLREEDIGPGPVVALTSLEDDSVRACRFGRELATLLGRELHVLHVVPDPAAAASYGIPAEQIEHICAEVRERSRVETVAWLAKAGVAADGTTVRLGDRVEQALVYASELRAVALVVGARQLPTAARTFLPSVGRELAASAPLAVAIVPPVAR